jgi:hypothetical protein
MSELFAFEPLYSPSSGTTGGGFQTSTTVTAINTSATASTVFAGTNNNAARNLQIANTTTSWAYVNVGVSGSVPAATVAASYPIAPGAVVVLTVAAEVNAASVILGAAPGTNTAVIFTRGVGL